MRSAEEDMEELIEEIERLKELNREMVKAIKLKCKDCVADRDLDLCKTCVFDKYVNKGRVGG